MYFETHDLSVGYGGRPLIEKINLSIEKGRILTLIGPNGCGKINNSENHHQAPGKDRRRGDDRKRQYIEMEQQGTRKEAFRHAH